MTDLSAPASAGATHGAPALRLRSLQAVGFVSFFDRFAAAPMLVVLASRIGIGLDQAVQLTSVYAFCYALGQPVWGVVSDRIGRTVVLRIALGGMVVGGIASVASSGYVPLLVARAVTGLMVGGLFPVVLTMLGDALPPQAKSRQISNLQTATALGTTAATLGAGTVAAWLDWRAVFVLSTAFAVALLLALRRAPNLRPPRAIGVASALRSVAGSPWALWLLVLGLVEGAVMLGILTYVIPALEADRVPVALAGTLAACYGAGVLLGAQTAKTLGRGLSRPARTAVGGAFLVVAYGLCALEPTVVPLTVASVLVGLANAFLHAALQGWATEVVPEARATAVSFFVCSLFLGSALATATTAGVASAGRFGAVFAGAGVVSLLLAVAATGSIAVWQHRHVHHTPQEA